MVEFDVLVQCGAQRHPLAAREHIVIGLVALEVTVQSIDVIAEAIQVALHARCAGTHGIRGGLY